MKDPVFWMAKANAQIFFYLCKKENEKKTVAT